MIDIVAWLLIGFLIGLCVGTFAAMEYMGGDEL